MATKLGKILADFTTSLATALAVGGTSATLQSATDDDGIALPAGRYFFTLDGGNSSKEHISCDLSGTALTNIKTVSRQGVEAAGVVRTHRIGCTVSLTDFAHIKFINDLISGATQLNSLVPLEYDGAPTISGGNMLATKTYVDTQVSAGAGQASPTVQGIVEVATQAEVDAGTATGGTGAYLIIPPSLLRAKAYHDYAVDAVGTDAYAITITPAIIAYAAGQHFTFKAATANTGPATLNVSGLGAKAIVRGVSTALVTGDILANQIVEVVYDGTSMVMTSPVSFVPSNPIINVYTASGTWTKPANLKYIVVEVIGGGGAGGTGNNESGGAGGGGGGYSKEILAASALGATEDYVVGAAAGTSNFGTAPFLQATGGSNASNDTAGSPGVGSNGTLNIHGQGGNSADALTGTTRGGGGVGGSSHYGGGGKGAVSGNVNGEGGGNYGGGGGGGGGDGSGAGGSGGAGVGGVVIVTEYYS